MLTINFKEGTIRLNKIVYVAIKRKGKNILYNSGLIYFTKQATADEFKDALEMKGLEVIEVDIRTAHPPKRIRPEGIYCPYCQQQNEWPKNGSYKNCPICGMSDSDFWVRKFNKGLK